MDHVIYFSDLFKSIPDCRKIVLLMFLSKNNVALSNECGFIKSDINRLCTEFRNVLMEKRRKILRLH